MGASDKASLVCNSGKMGYAAKADGDGGYGDGNGDGDTKAEVTQGGRGLTLLGKETGGQLCP